ncbi:MAG: peptidoglycan-binding protein, partial [Alphaproteobacteria bacterium]|nr:peptidoglycan-binding protein [Alphaproteobacteria bacterium]
MDFSLSGSAREEASRQIERHLELQRKLQQTGFLPATAKIDGVYSSVTRAAILAWQKTNGRPETGFISDADAAVLSMAAP